ncbi:hypothetical protein, partial [Gemmobacter denitrificans]
MARTPKAAAEQKTAAERSPAKRKARPKPGAEPASAQAADQSVGQTLTAAPVARPAPRRKAADKPAPSSAGTAPQRQAVIVLAMHRTGSSALTRVLNLLGCDTAKTLMGPNEHNKSGYWESDVLRVFNDKLLASAGSDWRDWRAFNPGWYDTPRLEEFLEQGSGLLASEFGASRFFVFKDPRITRIMPFWRRLLARAGVDQLHVLLTLRHPLDVAASLMERDGMAEAEALLIWLRNVLEAEQGSRGLPRVVVDYDRFLAAPSATMAAVQKPLGLVWPRLSDSVAEEIDRFMTPGLRHHKVASQEGFAEAQILRAWLAEVHGIFQRWAERGEDKADWPALDAVRSAMDALARPLAEVVGALTRLSAGVAGKDKELAYLRGEAGKRGDAVTALTAEKAALTRQLTELTAARADWAEREAKANQELAYLRGEAGKRADAVTALTADKAALSRQLDEQAAALEAERTARGAEAARVAQLLAEQADWTQREAKANQELAYLRGEAGKRGDAVTALTSDKAMLTRQLTELTAALEAERAARSAETARLAQLLAEQVDWTQREAKANQELAYLRGEAGKRADAITALTAEKAALQGQLAAERAQHQETAAALARREQEADALLGQSRELGERQLSELAGLARLLHAAEARVQELEQTLAAAAARETALAADLAQYEAELAALRDEHHVLRSTLDQRSHEIDQTRAAEARAQELEQTLAAAAARETALAADLAQYE